MFTKLFLPLAAVLFISTLAQAADLMTVDCSVSTASGSMTVSPILRSGMREDITCAPHGCFGAEDFTIMMNYNGNTYEDVTIEITHVPTGLMATTTHHNLRVGSDFEFGLGNWNKPEFGLGLFCTVSSVAMLPPVPVVK